MHTSTAAEPVNPTKHRGDSRVRLLVGILAILTVCLAARQWDGPGPLEGGSVNQALHTLRHHADDPARCDEALAVLRDVALRSPADARPWIRWGKALLAQDRPHRALVALQWATSLEPHSYRLAFDLAKAQGAAGFTSDAIRTLEERVFSQRPRHADGLYLRAALAAESDDYAGTLSFLGQAIRFGASRPGQYRTDASFDRYRTDEKFQSWMRELTAPGKLSATSSRF